MPHQCPANRGMVGRVVSGGGRMNRVDCHNCGGRVEVPAGHTRPKIRCTHCGYYAVVPAAMRADPEAEDDELPTVLPESAEEDDEEEAPRPKPKPAKKGKKKAAPAAEVTPLLAGTQEDDDLPYAVPGDAETKPCPACGKPLPIAATFCVHCGGDLSAGVKKKRKFQPIDRKWESTATLLRRLQAFGAIQVLNLFMLVNMLVSSGYNGVAFGMVFFNVLMQAFLVGTYDAVTVKRTSKGAATITRQWRVCFLPQPVMTVDWKKSHGIGVVAYHEPMVVDWGFFLFLLAAGLGQFAGYLLGGGHPVGLLIVFPLAVLPPAAWYWFVIRPDRFNVSLTDEYGGTNEILFRCTDREQADDVCRVFADATGLWYKAVL